MNEAGLAHLAYDWRGGRERIVRIGRGETAVLFLAPLFEEANRTRYFLLDVMRKLAARGFTCFLPDLPGTLESSVPFETVRWSDWEDGIAAAAAVGQRFHLASLRGGVLLDGAIDALSRWRLAPADGPALMRDLVRIRIAADREAGIATSAAAVEQAVLSAPFEVAGYRFNPAFLRAMKDRAAAEPGTLRVTRLETDVQAADAKLPGQPLWRRSEPGHDPILSQMVADDISQWIASCANG